MNITAFESILSAGELGSLKAYWKRNFYIVLGVVIFNLALKQLISGLWHLSSSHKTILLLASFITPLVINLLLFLFYRYPMLSVRFSKKTNIVFAYNLQGLNEEKFERKLKTLLAELQNKIDAADLGKKVNIKVAPSDVRLKDKTVAEAKVLLGLEGSTILVWGYVVRDKGKTKFVTKFSYEFAFAKNKASHEAKAQMESYVDGVLTNGLCSMKMDPENFVDQILPTTYFVLGITTYTLGLFDKSEEYFDAFRQYFSDANILRKQDLRQALIECNERSYFIQHTRLPFISSDLDNNESARAIQHLEQMLLFRPNDYFCHLNLAYLHGLRNERDASMHHSALAERYAPRGVHAHVINNAYFAILRQDYAEALRLYESIPDVIEINVSETTNFLNKKYNETKEIAFLFADGYVSLRWGDRAIGIESMRNFRLRAEQDAYEPLLNYLESREII